MKHKMSLYGSPFDRIASGKKVIEVRLFDEKRQKVGLGDTITFTKLPDKKEVVTVEVTGLSRFRSFRDLFSAFDKSKFDHPETITVEDQVASEREVYSEEREHALGVLGIHIRLTN